MVQITLAGNILKRKPVKLVTIQKREKLHNWKFSICTISVARFVAN